MSPQDGSPSATPRPGTEGGSTSRSQAGSTSRSQAGNSASGVTAREQARAAASDDRLAEWSCSAIASRPAWIEEPRRPRLPVDDGERPDPGAAADAAARALTPVDVSVINPGTPWSRPPDVSVVFHVRNDLARLSDALTHWRAACASRRTQIVVLDAGSTDRISSTILSEHRPVTLLRTGSDLGPAWSIDIGLARCEGSVLLLADTGARPSRGDIDTLCAHLDAHPRCGVAAAALQDAGGSALPGSAPRPTLRHLLVEESGLARLWPDNPWRRRLATREQDAAAGPSCPNPPAGLLALRREALDEVGPLDTNLPFHMHHLDWYRRMAQAGWELHLLSELAVPLIERPLSEPGDPGQFAAEFTSDDAWRRHRDRIRYARKHHGPWGVRCATLSLWSYALVEALARLAGRSEPEHRGVFGAFDALLDAARVRASA